MKPSHKGEKKKTVKKEVVVVKKTAPKPKTIERISHVPMQSVKMIKMGGAVLGRTTFETMDYSINAGNSYLWPRLAQVAKTYQYWRAVRWQVKYEPIASVFGANKSGVVTVSLLENWYDAPPDTMTAQTERARRSITIPAWESGTLTLDPTRWKYVRDSEGSQGQDMRLDDEIIEVGVEGTDGASAGQAIGYLYLTADIEFRVPYTVSLLHPPRSNRVFTFAYDTNVNYASSPTGVSTAVGLYPTPGAYLNNVAYTGTILESGALNLYGGTYCVRFYFSMSCASVPASTDLSFSATGANKLVQLELPGYRVNNVTANFADSGACECVVSVNEGSVAALAPSAKCIQAASATMIMTNYLMVVIPL